MIVKASVRPVLISAIGLFVFFADPSQGAPGPGTAPANSKEVKTTSKILHKNLRHGRRHTKSYGHREPHKITPMAAAGEKVAVADATADTAVLDIPPSVANANAQLQPMGTKAAGGNASPLVTSDPAQDPANARADDVKRVVAADQLNDVDRALREEAATPAATANPPASSAAAAKVESSTWGQTSLIGKIFIGFGALLTMASAARMFIS